jgi:uncharacterized metal-binding protein YceD (DUF177 family)
MKEYIIPFSGLKEGFHSYDFQVGKKFFEHFDFGEIEEGNVKIDVELEKQTRMLVLSFSMSGYVDLPCDRCGDPLQQELLGESRLFVKFGHEPGEESEDVIVISDRDHQIDISHYIFEFINLQLPFKRIHGEDGKSSCNPEVLEYLKESTQQAETDPRWDALRKLQNKKD